MSELKREPQHEVAGTATGGAEARAIAEELRRVVHGEAWHGPALLELLADVSPEAAAAAAVPGAHTIWQLVLHLTGWTDVVLRRLDGHATEEPVAGDFPALPAPTAAAWSAARTRLAEVHEVLIARLTGLADGALDAPVPGRDYDARVMLRGLVHHVVYHSGQIGVLKKTLSR